MKGEYNLGNELYTEKITGSIVFVLITLRTIYMMLLFLSIILFAIVSIFGYLRKNKTAIIIGGLGVLIPNLFLVVLFIGITFLGWD